MSTKEDDYILAGLTEEERAALAEPDDESTTATQGELEAAAGATKTPEATTKDDDADDEKDPPADGADADDVVAADAPAAAAAPADTAKPADAAAPAAAEPSPAPSAPVFVAQAPADAKEKLEELGTQKTALMTKHDDGDITTAEFHQQLDTINKAEREIERAVDKAEIAADMEKQRQKNQWDADCNSFFKAHDQYNTDPELFAHLNETVMAFAKMPRNKDLSGPDVLAKAHAAVMMERGTPVAAAAAAPAAKKAATAPKPALPPSLAGMPAAAGNEAGEGRFAHLDALQAKNPLAYEAELAKLPAAELDAYLAT